MQRGNDRHAVFFRDDDYAAYLDWLRQGAEKYACAIHAYVLMTNHVHLLLTPEFKDSISKTIQSVGRNHVTYVNHTYGRSGTLWDGRHKGSIVSSEEYLLVCMRYIEMNPVRAGMVKTPGEYRWSSYLTNSSGNGSEIITPHSSYLRLGREAEGRGYAYR